jgi:hypothetical protein
MNLGTVWDTLAMTIRSTRTPTTGRSETCPCSFTYDTGSRFPHFQYEFSLSVALVAEIVVRPL